MTQRDYIDDFIDTIMHVSKETLTSFVEAHRHHEKIYDLERKCCEIGSLEYLKIIFSFLSAETLHEHVDYCLLDAIQSQSMDIVDFLIDECSATINIEEKLQEHDYLFLPLMRIPLKEAINTGNVDFVRKILDAGANVHGSCGNALIWCIEYSGPKGPIWDLLLSYGPDINFIGPDGSIFLHVYDDEDIKTLVKLGADINSLDDKGKNLLENILDKIGKYSGIGNHAEYFDIQADCEQAVALIENGCNIPNEKVEHTLKVLFEYYLDEDVSHIFQ